MVLIWILEEFVSCLSGLGGPSIFLLISKIIKYCADLNYK